MRRKKEEAPKKPDGRTVEGRMEKLRAETAAYTKYLSEVKAEYDRLLTCVKPLRMLLASYNALTDKGEVKLEKPDNGKPYWYIRAMPTIKKFEVVACTWNDWQSDHYRYAMGNMFLDQLAATQSCMALNIFLAQL